MIRHQRRLQRFRPEWQEEPEFRAWLMPVPGTDTRARCAICPREFNAAFQVVQTHSNSEAHRQACVRRRLPGYEREIRLANQVDTGTLKLAGVFADRNLAFLLADYLTPVMKSIDPESEVWRRIKMNRLDVQKIVKNCIAVAHKEDLSLALTQSKFTVQFDETTDISQIANACIVVKYLDFEKREIVTALWEITTSVDELAHDHDTSAAALYNCIINSFNRHAVPLDNLKAFGSDGCNTMMGLRNSVSQRFQRDFPGIKIVKCPSHRIHLCAEHAIKALPRDVIQFCTNLHSFFSRSPKRQHELVAFQEFLDLEIHKILRPSPTRWLSLQASIERITEQWQALVLFFNDAFLAQNIENAHPIFNFLHCKTSKCFILFLNFILPIINTVNRFFQKKGLILHKIKRRLTTLFKEVASLFLNPNYVRENDPSDIEHENPDYFVGVDDINLGNAANNHLATAAFTEDEKYQVKMYCLGFLRALCTQLKTRFNNFNENFYDGLECLAPENALSALFRERNRGILTEVIQNFRHLLTDERSVDAVQNQWALLPFTDFPERLRNVEIEASLFWFEIYFFRNDADEFPFQNLAKFFLEISLTPHSNAEPERVWSKLKLTKTRIRNKLHLSTVNGLLLAGDCIKKTGGCAQFQPTERMLELFRNFNNNELVAQEEIVVEQEEN